MVKKLLSIIPLSLGLLNASIIQDINSAYVSKDYKKAYDKLQVLLDKNPTNIKANLLLANCAYNLSLYDKAMAAYDRVLILDENNAYAKIQEAKIYLKNKNTYMAKLELDSLLKLKTLSDKHRQTVLDLRAKIQKKQEQKKKAAKSKYFNGSFNAGLMYSTNPNSDIGNKSYIVPANSLPYKGESEKSDFSAFARVNVSFEKEIDESFGIFSSFDVYTNNYFKESQNNLAYLVANVSPYFYQKGIKLLLPLSYNRVFSENHSFVDTYGIGVEALKDIKNGQLDLGYKFSVNKYYGKNKAKDATHHDLYAGIQAIVSSDILTYAYLRYVKNKEKKDLRTDVNYNSYGFDMGMNKEIYKKLMAKLAISYKNYTYTDQDKMFLNKRKDNVYSYIVGLNYNIDNVSFIDVDLNYVNKSSNQFLYDYDNIILSSSYSYKF